jgi:YidC/Oxa1 family membrane protein insertase
MNFDRNTVIGFVILALLFMGYFYWNSREQALLQKEKTRQDSIAKSHQPKTDPVAATKDSLLADSVRNAPDTSIPGSSGTEQLSVIENDLIRIGFTSKGGQPKWVELKKFKGPDSNVVKLSSTDFDRISYPIVTPGGKTTEISSLYFSGGEVVKNGDVQTITYSVTTPDGNSIQHQFVVRPDYMVDFNLQLNGVNKLLTNNTLYFNWQNKAIQLQKDLSYERQQSQIGYREDGDYDHSSATRNSSEEFKHAVNWVAVKQQFFNTTFIAKNNFTGGEISWKAPESTDQKTVVEAVANMRIQLSSGNSANVPLAFYYGPTDYKILKKYGNDMEDMVNLGSGMFAFVKYINRWVIIPIFNFFASFVSNFGIVILLLTLFIRLLISPLTYSSYLSGAKMKVLRPEIEKLKAKYGSDQQQISMEQMKLFKEAGVNPLGGCIPALLQIPIFFALYSFFNSNVALRGQHFLWSKDLSQYDSILDFGNVPLLSSIYGNHVSLFTITAVLTSFLISLYSMSMTPDQNNPVLKYMPYFFPIVLLFIFNKLPSGLTWYYTVSNLITLALQFVIQKYIIDHDKILAKIEINRKKPKSKSKFQERLEQIQEQQKQLKQNQNKNRR